MADIFDEIIWDLAKSPKVKKYLKEGEKGNKMIRKLNEDTLAQATAEAESKEEVKDILAANDVVDGDATFSDDSGDIEKALNRSLERALEAQKTMLKHGHVPDNYPNLIFVGEAGTGKTARVKAWAKKHNVNLFLKQTATLDETDLGGIPAVDFKDGVVKKFTTTELDQLQRENSVLFLDEFNRANAQVRGTLLTFIQDHVLADQRQKDGMKYFPSFLFTVICVNPATASYNTELLDKAERGRGRKIYVKSDPAVWLKYFRHLCDLQVQYWTADENAKGVTQWSGRKWIATALIEGGLTFSSVDEFEEPSYEGNGDAINPRNLSMLLEASDGTKEDVIEIWNDFCDSARLAEVKSILKNYKDVDDKANKALKSSPVFKSKKQKMADQIADIEATINGL